MNPGIGTVYCAGSIQIWLLYVPKFLQVNFVSVLCYRTRSHRFKGGSYIEFIGISTSKHLNVFT
jgi:hypothetical protein